MEKKCIIITTIYAPSEQIQHYASLNDWTLIIVGDSKTDDARYTNINCVYLGLNEQKELFPTFYDKVPLKSYTRKMFGYLYAIQHKFTVVYDTDDDNKYIGDLNDFSTLRPTKTCIQKGFANIYRVFTKSYIWPRGIPPGDESIRVEPILSDTQPPMTCAIIQGLVNNDPDVDAYYRMNVNSSIFTFEKDDGYDVLLDKYSVCPFNTQNTFWTDPSVFYAMYLPTTVTFRYTDILRGFVALFQLWKHDKTIKFTLPTAYQKRNEHDLQKDYESEIPMYETAKQVITLLESNVDCSLYDVYKILANNNIVSTAELPVLREWLSLIDHF